MSPISWCEKIENPHTEQGMECDNHILEDSDAFFSFMLRQGVARRGAILKVEMKNLNKVAH